jgi:hypothetical protein
MDSDKVNRWLTFGANIGVLVGIILILIELNQNSDLMRAQMTQSRADQLSNKYDTVIHSDYWPDIAAKRDAVDSDSDWIASLTPSELVRVRYRFFREFDDVRNQFYQYQEGFLPERIWRTSTRSQIRRLLGYAAALEQNWDGENLYEDEFRAMLLEIAEEEGFPVHKGDGVWE